MNYWILQTNPNAFLTYGDLPHSEGDLDWWCLSRRNKIKDDDIVFIWQSIDRRYGPTDERPRGIYAQGHVVSAEPADARQRAIIVDLKRDLHTHWVSDAERKKQESKPVELLIQYDRTWWSDPLTCDELKNLHMAKLHIITFPNLEICPVAPREATRLLATLKNKHRS